MVYPMRYSLVIPAYNESTRIGATLDKVLSYISAEGWNVEIIVVNDGSTDNTAELVRGFQQRYPALRLLENPGNRGKGYSVRAGMLHATGDVLVFSDADLSSPIYEVGKLLMAIHRGADVAIGSRWLDADLQTERQPVLRQIAGRLYNLLTRVLLGFRFRDTQCGLKAFTREAAEQIFPRQRIERWGFDPELLYLARHFRFRIAEVPVEWAHDDRSKINPLVDGVKMFGEMLGIRWNALRGRYIRPASQMAPRPPESIQADSRPPALAGGGER
jgi:dolichyl-phosphate beta-glucosyltransferase